MDSEDKTRLIKKYYQARYIADKTINRYELFCQCVQIAAEQIQEVEISLIKERFAGKGITVKDFLVDILFVFFIEARVIPIIAKGIVQKFFTSIQQTKLLAEKFSPQILKSMDEKKLWAMIKDDEPVKKALLTRTAELEKYVTEALGLGTKVISKVREKEDTSGNRVIDPYKNIGRWEQALANNLLRPYLGHDIPGYDPNIAKGFKYKDGQDKFAVAFIKSAFSSLMDYKIKINSAFAMFQEDLMLMLSIEEYYASLPKETVSDITPPVTLMELAFDKIIEGDIGDFDYENMRLYMSIEIEKILWVALYGGQITIAGRGFNHDDIRDAGIITNLDPVSGPALQDYWWARFPNPDTGMPFRNKYHLFDHFKLIYSDLVKHGIQNAMSRIAEVRQPEP